MSQSFVRGSANRKATTCPHCRRTVVLELLDDGTTVATDTELIGAVVKRASPGKRTSKARAQVRRVHAEQCDRYKLDDERREWAKAAKKAKRTNTLLADPALTIAPPAAPKYTTIADARRAVLASYKALAKKRARA